MRLTRGDDVVIRLLLLQYLPQHFDVLRRVSPGAASLEIAEMKESSLTRSNRGNSARYLTRDELRSPKRRLMIEQNAAARKHAVRLSVIYGAVMSEYFRDSVRTPRIEARRFTLRYFRSQA